jgi:hypothetical protein
MHRFRLALIAAVLCGAAYGCATPDEPAARGAQTQASETRHDGGTHRTGSRLPSYDSDGSSSTGAVSKDDFTDQMNRGTSGRSPGMAP